MYCVKCGVRLADTEQKCPLCETVVYHPDIRRPEAAQLYPSRRMPKAGSGRKALSGMIVILFLIPFAICLFSDLQLDGKLDWFGYVAGGLGIAYLTFAFPLWFRKPNPVILLPCDFAAVAFYLMYIDLTTGGGWFWTFGLPVTAGFALVICAVVTLLYYLRRGRLYICGGGLMGLGVLALVVELLMAATFQIPLVGWSGYPMAVLSLLGGLLIYLGINSVAREVLARKLFF